MCCGKKRAQARKTIQTQQVSKPEKKSIPQTRPQSEQPYFQYLGKTGLTVMGPRTRKSYRFDHSGAVVAVDPKDQRAMAAVSVLRQVEK